MNKTTDMYKDEIELMDILLYFWKWKYFFLGGMFLCAVLFVIFFMYAEHRKPKTYEIEFTLKVGTAINKYGLESYIKSPAHIVEGITSGAFNEDIKKILQKDYPKTDYNELTFEIAEDGKQNGLIAGSHNATDVDQGIATVKALVNAINDQYSDVIQTLKNDIEKEKATLAGEEEKLAGEIEIAKDEIQANEDYLKKIKIRLNEIKYELDALDESDKLGNRADISDETNSLNIYYEKKKLKAMYKDKMLEYAAQINNTSLLVAKNEQKLKALKQQYAVAKGKYQEQSIDPRIVKILKDPVVKETPQEFQAVSMFFLGAATGFFIILFLTFFLEYFQRYKIRREQKQ